MIITGFDREFLMYHFKDFDEHLKINTWKNIEIPDPIYRDLKKFIKRNQINEIYTSELFGVFCCCTFIFDYGKELDKYAIENTDIINLRFDLIQLMKEEIIEINIIGKCRKLKTKNKEFIKPIKNILIKMAGETKENKRAFNKKNISRMNLSMLSMRLFMIFHRDFKIKHKSYNQLYEQIYDFLKLAGFFTILGLSSKADIIKKLLQKKT